MKENSGRRGRVLTLCWLLLCWTLAANALANAAPDPLPSWADGPAKTAVTGFVQRVTSPGSKDFVPVPERIAVFDHDGTLWAEQPIYPQMVFAIQRVRTLAPRFPGWRHKQPFRAAIEGDLSSLARSGSSALMQLTMATHAGMTTEQFDRIAGDWMISARHPRFRRPYTDLAYQPMLELLAHLRTHGFKTWIVSGGGADFIRVWAERAYGIPPEQVIGSTLKTTFEISGNRSALIHLPEIDFLDNHAGKPVAIQRTIGRRPILAFGNSDGDLEMLQWTSTGPGPRLAALIHHTDAQREWAYDRESPVGQLDLAWREAERRRWLVVDMRRDWKRVFPFDH
jgi:phosphoglycolate phosphatase-like HAD superfamily hydrolase